ncbi:MAG: cofactor-independent phosphoglycerate mutase [Deltaproteobacteria bacterium]|nr:MAG: cofactor-independent phosphoglycerate mutase [Deltaproteobacteria bacterium]
MKYVIVIGDGMADWKIEELGKKTPLEVAEKPAADRMAREGLLGLVQVVPKDMYPGSDVSNLSILGYDPARYYTGRSPLEAASIGVNLGPDDVAVRCNIVTIEGEIESGLMVDYSAGHVTTEEAARLLESLNEAIGNERVRFYPGVSYRNLMVWSGGEDGVQTVPPHDIMGQPLNGNLPKGEGSEFLISLMKKSREVFADHPVNRERRRQGKREASCVWLWGQGKAPVMPSFRERFGMDGSVIAAVDLIRGIGKYLALEIVDVPGATGYVDTNFEGKGRYCIERLREKDFVLVHIEAPDEAGHNGDAREKVRAIEKIDRFVLSPLLELIDGGEDIRVLFLPDHPTPVEIRTHSNEPVPFLIYPWDGDEGGKGGRYTEDDAKSSGVFVEKGTSLIELLLGAGSSTNA